MRISRLLFILLLQISLFAEIPDSPPEPYPRTIPQGLNVRLKESEIKYIEGKIPPVITPLYILHDDSRHSRMLKAELARKWGEYDTSLEYLDDIKDNLLVKEIIFVDYKNLNELKKARVKNTPEVLPAYRLSVAGNFIPFPSTCFACDTWPLLSTNAIINKNSYLPELWIKKVNFLNEKAENKIRHYALYYISLNKLDINEYTNKICTRCDNYLRHCDCNDNTGFWNRQIRYSLLEEFPSYVPPRIIYPTKPITKMPWETVDE
jgi:hypothetical protein